MSRPTVIRLGSNEDRSSLMNLDYSAFPWKSFQKVSIQNGLFSLWYVKAICIYCNPLHGLLFSLTISILGFAVIDIKFNPMKTNDSTHPQRITLLFNFNSLSLVNYLKQNLGTNQSIYVYIQLCINTNRQHHLRCYPNTRPLY